MPGVWTRHPCYIIILGFCLVSTIFILLPKRTTGLAHEFYMPDSSLKSRLARSNWVYDRLVAQRPNLIKKHGENAGDLSIFPPNKQPWPAYTVWGFFPAAFHCPHEIERLGALGDGGKWVCGLSRVKEKGDCVIYSFGINYESSFEAAVLQNTNHCQIWGYDFSVKSFGPEIPSDLVNRTHFEPYGLSGSNAHEPTDKIPMYTLETLLNMNEHTYIDILKIDIEGWEFETLSTLIKPYIASGKPLPFGQLQLEIHLWLKPFEEFLGWWEDLEAAGLRPFWTEPNLVYLNYNKKHTPDLAEYSFLNIKGNNSFISD